VPADACISLGSEARPARNVSLISHVAIARAKQTRRQTDYWMPTMTGAGWTPERGARQGQAIKRW